MHFPLGRSWSTRAGTLLTTAALHQAEGRRLLDKQVIWIDAVLVVARRLATLDRLGYNVTLIGSFVRVDPFCSPCYRPAPRLHSRQAARGIPVQRIVLVCLVMLSLQGCAVLVEL